MTRFLLFHCLIWSIKHHTSHFVNRKWSFLRDTAQSKVNVQNFAHIREHNLAETSPLADGDNNVLMFDTSITRCLSSSA